ncbi:Bis(5'-adenosyl)-triphosphatase [Handroanthus impetiginosus]|uniref:Bis(5'-adenosyl)-triphosphatase n=1 Tax=Handroanthus impetiginosus TaxID=429701 RepID=A0A2G9GXW3_9LAMI|nr:Bis(5'-adenosyl)-triphosphatase [Handroanthus impetiginosus]
MLQPNVFEEFGAFIMNLDLDYFRCYASISVMTTLMHLTGSLQINDPADSFNLLVNNGAAAGQVVYHTHIHIIPRKARDCLWTSESIRRHPLKPDQEASRLANCIRENLSFVNLYEDSKGQDSSLVGN